MVEDVGRGGGGVRRSRKKNRCPAKNMLRLCIIFGKYL
jgi:hypothetical protein